MNAPQTPASPSVTAPVDYVLHLADNALVLGQRNAEWCGHGPILEEDLALANNSLDLIGQARMLYQHAATLINADATQAARFAHLHGARQGGELTEDTLAYFRDVPEFRNFTLLELPHHGPLAGTAAGDRDYATTITRNFLYSALMVLVWERLQTSSDAQLAAIAAKSLKEVRYHLRHASDWLVRFGDGTDESHCRAQAALTHLLPYCQEFWIGSPTEQQAATHHTGVRLTELQANWNALVDETLTEATLQRPSGAGFVPQGQLGVHSEHMGFLVAEMQSLARNHPEAVW
ncbi:MAG: 1,2-phenylacetyl-CoA epoxidase subunit PaaC [Hydrogenophaga sp.]|jgi:ring-1,2-phenylacetyl-CoA epoxidase subunit PaaC|uniref:1,2-phenylacetyl-CoA epoxidase subunit PaaC n=1 Tax=Hydrogenophaga sp. TaxID=1904254 RepID=UPI002726DB7F|nr:1,2-phenylacetyl-CoA epoxidase subunit PaaC [Hydrogenophaga sp.]MDO9481974.1 1,2-phenylacetyl-CoA epoxidase subunit PaaC [Hydrogenophaga sp.]MDP3342972.1 1,2-phenylacetyl-CoA epoxidase subunit PaaC [Hydrogenophaga sp.]MDP3808254.1 1,2-phenylacetyl-CoA epoxidase subunit PaaC [Hydrogenophaga sp.]MDZ4238208.1 1,2-phenylacetyl-CoA epoxidase subunit PaaC [Hydrogenophaga sp.]